MKFWKTLVIGTAVCGLFTCASCKKAEQAPTETAAVEAADITAVSQSLKKWDKAEVNSLLRYVPADTFGMIMSTRNVGLDDPRMKLILDSSKKTLENAKKNLPQDDDPSISAIVSLYDEALSFLSGDITAAYKKWGLSEKSDSVAYLTRGAIVAKQSIADSKIFKDRIDGLVKKVNNIGKKPIITSKEIKDGNVTWVLYGLDKELSAGDWVFAVNYGSVVATYVVLAKELPADKMAAYLKPAEKPLKVSDLNVGEKDVVSYGYLDNSKIMSVAKLLLGDVASSDEDLKTFFSDDCVKEINGILNKVPRSELIVMLDGKNEVRTDYRLDVADKKLLGDLKSITNEPSLHMPIDKSLASAFINVNPKNLIGAVKSYLDVQKGMKYKCPLLSDMNELGSIDELDALLKPYMVPIENISGAGAVLNSIDMEKEMVTGAVALSGKEMDKVLVNLILLLGNALDNFKGIIPDDENVKHFNEPIVGSSVATTNAIVVATDPIDVKTVAASPMKKHDAIIDVKISSEFIEKVLSDVLPDDTGYHIAFGTDDKGIFLTTGVLY